MPISNDQIADQLDQIANLLEIPEDANPFRVQAYRQAAAQVRQLDRSVDAVLEAEGQAGLEEIPDIGAGLAGVITEIAYSNTARAHDLGKTDDWVVIYHERDKEEEGQVTVVTETQGDLEGKRVVRGREQACRRFYQGKE